MTKLGQTKVNDSDVYSGLSMKTQFLDSSDTGSKGSLVLTYSGT